MNVEEIRNIVLNDGGEFRDTDEIISDLKSYGLSEKEIKGVVNEIIYEAKELQKNKRWLIDLCECGYFKVEVMQKISPNMYELIGEHILITDDEDNAKDIQENGYELINSTATRHHLSKTTRMTVVLDDDDHYHPLVANWSVYEID